jgi:predicted DNA binding protein
LLAGLKGTPSNRRKEVNKMATQKEIHELIGRAVADADFRAKLVEDPEKAVKETGLELTEEQMATLKQADLKGFSSDLDERLSKSAVGTVQPSW